MTFKQVLKPALGLALLASTAWGLSLTPDTLIAVDFNTPNGSVRQYSPAGILLDSLQLTGLTERRPLRSPHRR